MLYGGVRRYRFLKSGNRGEGRTKRRAAERVVIASSIPTEQDGQSGTQKNEDCSSWLQVREITKIEKHILILCKVDREMANGDRFWKKHHIRYVMFFTII